MAQEAAETVAAVIAVIGEGEAMPAEGGDRKYVVDGRAWRVRLRMVSQRQPIAPINGEPELAPVSFCYGISVALLDGDGAVAKDDDGALFVFDQHTLSIDEDAMGRADFDPVEAVNFAIASEISAATSILAKKERLVTALADWPARASVPAPAPTVPPPASTEIAPGALQYEVALAEVRDLTTKLAEAEAEIERRKAAAGDRAEAGAQELET